jgi:Universal stress protein family
MNVAAVVHGLIRSLRNVHTAVAHRLPATTPQPFNDIMTQTTRPTVDRILLPVANEDDAKRTCTAVRPRLSEDNAEIVALYVVERREGGPAAASLEQLEEHGQNTLTIVEEEFAGSTVTVETELREGVDLIETIFAAAEDCDVDCIVFVPRPKGRLVALLSGDPGWKLINKTQHPILVLPRPTEATQTE